MLLIVENKDITLHFISYLKHRMLRHLATLLNTKRLNEYDDYFNSDAFKAMCGEVRVSARRVILLGMTNLSHKRYEEVTHIFINPNINYPDTNLKVVDLCKVINYGTLSIDAYPIISETFDHFSNNIEKYKERCMIGLG